MSRTAAEIRKGRDIQTSVECTERKCISNCRGGCTLRDDQLDCPRAIRAELAALRTAGETLSCAIAQFQVRFDHPAWNDAVRNFRAALSAWHKAGA